MDDLLMTECSTSTHDQQPFFRIGDLEQRGISLRQLRLVVSEMDKRCENEGWVSVIDAKRGERLTPKTVTLYDLCDHMIVPDTCQRSCSYVELIADRKQPPDWYVSHWWGEYVHRLLDCLSTHAEDEGLGEDVVYWVCAFANRQHDQGEMGFTMLEDSPCMRVLRACKVSPCLLAVRGHGRGRRRRCMA